MSEAKLMANMHAALDKAMERKSDTPRTDYVVDANYDRYEVLAFARKLEGELCEKDARIKLLEDAAKAVAWFDWSGNYADAVASIERLRETLK